MYGNFVKEDNCIELRDIRSSMAMDAFADQNGNSLLMLGDRLWSPPLLSPTSQPFPVTCSLTRPEPVARVFAFDVHPEPSAIGSLKHCQNVDFPTAEIRAGTAALGAEHILPPVQAARAQCRLLMLQAPKFSSPIEAPSSF